MGGVLDGLGDRQRSVWVLGGLADRDEEMGSWGIGLWGFR